MLIDEQRITKPTSDIPLNPDWFIWILILAYYNPHMIGQDSPPISNNQPGFSICPVGTRTPWKINGWNMSSWRFGWKMIFVSKWVMAVGSCRSSSRV